MTSDFGQLISTAEAAAMLNVSTRRIMGLCSSGAFHNAVKKGRKWLIPISAVLSYQKEAPRRRSSKTSAPLLPCAVGNSSYTSIANECYYVDKTLLVKDLIDDHSMVTLFTRPRRFGKTLALSMLKAFFELSETDTSVYFANKKIWQCGEKYRSLQGAFPVVMLTFKDVKFSNWQDSFEALQLTLKDEYRRHAELASSPKLTSDDKDYYSRMLTSQLSAVEYSRALLKLTDMLAAHYGEKAVILIDEYDTPIQQGYVRGFYQEVIDFMRVFLSGGLKDNPSLAFCVMTGIMRVSKENLFSGLNNPTVNTVLDSKYSEYFGFTEAEVVEMAEYYDKPERMDEIRLWYDGYHFGDTDIFNPWSVTSYFSNGCQPKAFWANTSDNEVIHDLVQSLTPETAANLANVLQGGEVQASVNMEVIYPRMTDSEDTIFSFLLLSGYLSPASPSVETPYGTYVSLRLPNAEVRRIYNTEVLSWIDAKSSSNVVSEISKSIFLSDGDLLQKALSKYLKGCASVFDGAAEGFYHGMMLGLVASLSSKYHIRSNRESGDGRFDLQLESMDSQLPSVIMEFKAAPADDRDKLDSLAKEALEQIERQSYDTELLLRNAHKIIKYGIAFSGKHVAVLTS